MNDEFFQLRSRFQHRIEKFEYFLHPVFDALDGQPFHYSDRNAKWDVKRLLNDHLTRLIGSGHRRDKSSHHREPHYSRLLFKFPDCCFVFYQLTGACGYLCVLGPDRTAVQTLLTDLEKRYQHPDVKVNSMPSFSLIEVDGRDVGTIPVEIDPGCRLSPDQLALHYGADFPAWEENLVEALDRRSTGITLLRGEPGTGKTSYLRHLVARLVATHEFYYLPVTHANWLADPRTVGFWTKAVKAEEDKRHVLILEDAEELLMERGPDNRNAVSTLLNSADGLLGDYLRLHIILTINAPVDRIDAALRRPGRLIALREFHRLDRTQALCLAQARDIELPVQADYSLAEIYHSSNPARCSEPLTKPIGFSV